MTLISDKIIEIEVENCFGFGEYCGDAGADYDMLFFEKSVIIKKDDEKRIRELIKKFKEQS